ncbi:hypothetical protein B9Z19DRAFT_1069299 [Tuber borchii]|uniref:Uncharacterized protein n=1 Tax=Tuber borchii TaxID=42251 RepID=A0A2T6ZC50_TUBBO|nr:hypothetical protein B9Z19DRAFT_1069299 [Tuber borchii]
MAIMDIKSIITIFHITIAKNKKKSYRIKQLLQALLASIKHNKIVFVASTDHPEHSKRRQKVPELATVDTYRINLTIEQFQLMFSNEIIHDIMVHLPFDDYTKDLDQLFSSISGEEGEDFSEAEYEEDKVLDSDNVDDSDGEVGNEPDILMEEEFNTDDGSNININDGSNIEMN